MRAYLKGLCLLLSVLTMLSSAYAAKSPTVTITPGYTTVGVSGTLQYTAAVTGLANTSVTWFINGFPGGNATFGTISASGLYQAPATLAYRFDTLVTALASDRRTLDAVYVRVEPAGPPITSIAPSPIPLGNFKVTVNGSGFQPGAVVRLGAISLPTSFVNASTLTAQGYAGDAGTGVFSAMNPDSMWGPNATATIGGQIVSPATAVVGPGGVQQFTSAGATQWTASAGTVNANGLFTAPNSAPSSGAIVVTARGPGGIGSAAVTVSSAAQTITPNTATVGLGQNQQFNSADVLSWAASDGKISAGGLYTAPASMPINSPVKITAIGRHGAASAVVTLTSAGKAILPQITTLGLNQTQQFSCPGSIAWLASPGTISATGLYTAPSRMPASSLVTITAAYGSGSATTTFNLAPGEAPISIYPAVATVSLGKSQQFTSAGAISWAASAGTVSPSGLFTAPASLPPSTTIAVIANGPTSSATAAVSLITPTPQSIAPASATVSLGKTQQFTSAGATSWTTTTGTVDSTGLYTAPSSLPANTAVTITAAGPNGSATANVSLVSLTPQTISPTTVSVNLGKTQQFTSAGATGWTTTAGAISASGLYTAPASMPSNTAVSVTASGPNGSASAAVNLVSPAVQTISPASASVLLGKTQQFTSTGATSWTASAGTVSASGLYTAPASMPSNTAVSVTATGPSGSATAAVNLVSPTVQTISPASASVLLGKTQQFTSTGATSWTASAGSISSNGLFTAPSSMPSNSAVSITASGPNGSASATVSLQSPPQQTVSPTAASVTLGKTQQFTSAGATNWTVTAGSISANGLYAAPSSMPSNPNVSVTATGPNGSATATVTLVSAPSLTIAPSAVTLLLGRTQQFTSSGATSWSATAGSVDSTGLFSAPATMPANISITVTASGASGSASATVTLAASSISVAGPVSISTQSPYYGWEVIPGSTRRIHAMVANGATSQVRWSYTTTGGATATVAPATAPNIPGAFVDVTLGSVGSACKNIGSASAPVFSSAASVTLTATSLDDTSKSVVIPIQVCKPPVQVYVSPFNVTLYSGQRENLQSWVWGAVNDSVTWAITSQPNGGDGTLDAPPSGGSATTSKDALFHATVAGRYTLTATSIADSSAAAQAILYVTGHAQPSYAATPNHTVPVDCTVDPALTGPTYDVGSGKPYASLAAVYNAVGGLSLSPGTTIRLFNTDTSGRNASRYHEYITLAGAGTLTQPIRLVGCPDSAGNLPILDGANATAYAAGTTNSLTGLYQVAIHTPGGAFGLYPTINAPTYIIVEGLAFRDAYPTLGSNSYSYYPAGSSTATPWPTSSSCIRPYDGEHVTIRGNDMEDCADGSLADFNAASSGWGAFFGDDTYEGNYLTNIGNNTSSYHMLYIQGWRQLIQGNTFDQLKSISTGGELKMRGVQEVVRYNYFNASYNTRTIDYVEEQDSNNYMSFLGYYYAPSGSQSFYQVYPSDAYTPDLLAAGDEAWHKAYAYGNIVNMGTGIPSSQTPFHYFGDQSPYADENLNPPVRVGDFFNYNNTVYSPGGNSLHLVDTQQNTDNQIRWEWPELTLWNNAVYVGPLDNAGGQSYQMSTLRSDVYHLGPMWLSSYWGTNALNCTDNTNNACVGTGWPWQQETTEYLDGANLQAHINGLSNLIVGGTTVPFSTATFAPTAGGGLVGAGTALPSSITNMPVRSQISPLTYAVTPRATPMTLGAHD